MSLCPNCIDKIYEELNFHKIEKFNTKIYTGAIYENELLKIIRAFKYHKKQEFAEILTDILIQTANFYHLNLTDFIVCPVPIHKNRFKQRKYNHMELVATEFAKHFNLKIDTTLLSRIKDTSPSYKLSASERKHNIIDAFIASDKIKNKKILILDDIITTGSTIKELSKIISEQEPTEIISLCVIRSNSCNF